MLPDCFDRFFTAFVLYNFLYNRICDEDNCNYPYKRDPERATKAVEKFLTASSIMESTVIAENAAAIKSLLESQTFYIRDNIWDRERVLALNTADPALWAIGLLEIVYKIRCNTFHGHKSFEDRQKRILVPCIKIIEELNDMLINNMSPH